MARRVSPLYLAFAGLLEVGEFVRSTRVDHSGVNPDRWFTRLVPAARTRPEDLLKRLETAGIELGSERSELARVIADSRALFAGGDGLGGSRFYVEHRSTGTDPRPPSLTAWKWDHRGALAEVTEYQPVASCLRVAELRPLVDPRAEDIVHLLAEEIGTQTVLTDVLEVTARRTPRHAFDAAVPELSIPSTFRLLRRSCDQLVFDPSEWKDRQLERRCQPVQRIALGADRCGHPFLTVYQRWNVVLG